MIRAKVIPIVRGKSSMPVSAAKVKSSLDSALKESANRLYVLFNDTTKTWSGKPTFVKKVDSQSAQVSTQSEKYTWVSEGTKAHLIQAQNGRLSFASIYQPKSAPGVPYALAGGSGGDSVFAKIVFHPGIKPRHFPEQVVKIFEPEFKEILKKHFKIK